jgi:membrane-associated phospholipid phosphatase
LTVGRGGNAMGPVDLLILAYNAGMGVLWAAMTFRGQSPHSTGILMTAMHVAFAGVLWTLCRRRRPSDRGATIRELYPLLAIGVFWVELGVLQRVCQAPGHDARVAAWDLMVFGQHLHRTWSAAMPARWLSELMYGAYFSYYLILIVPPLALAVRRRLDALRDVGLRVTATYLSCFAFYVVWPVFGPHAADPSAAAAGTPGFLHSLVDLARGLGDSPGTAFPSSHVAGALTMAWAAWPWVPRPAGLVLASLALLVAPATVYTGNHYAIDALAGVVWAILAQGVLVPVSVLLARSWVAPALLPRPVHR